MNDKIGEKELSKKISKLSRNSELSSKHYLQKDILKIIKLQKLAIEEEVLNGKSVNLRGFMTVRKGKSKLGKPRVQALVSKYFAVNKERKKNEP